MNFDLGNRSGEIGPKIIAIEGEVGVRLRHR